MTKKEISSRMFHKMPADLRSVITSIPSALELWENLSAGGKSDEV